MKYLILLSVIFLASCSYDEEFKEINVNSETSIKVPSYMKKTDELKENAVLQYRNKFRNCYLIVLESDKDGESLKQFQKDAVKVITNYLDNSIITDSATTEVNGLNAYHNSIFGKMETEMIYYDHLSIETDNKFYEVCTWTRGPERKDRYGDDLLKMIYSFRKR